MVQKAVNWLVRWQTIITLIGVVLVFSGDKIWMASHFHAKVSYLEECTNEMKPIVRSVPIIQERISNLLSSMDKLEKQIRNFNDLLWREKENRILSQREKEEKE